MTAVDRDHRDAAAADADDEEAAVDEPPDRAELDDLLRVGRRDDAPPVVAVGLDDPAALGGERACALLVVDRADELRRIAERGVVGVDEHARDDRDGVLVIDRVVELELDDVADLAAALGVEHVERIRGAVGVGVLLEREQADLRAVAVRDHEPRRLGDRAEHRRRLAGGAQLVGRGRRLAAPQQGVAAERDDGERPGRGGIGHAAILSHGCRIGARSASILGGRCRSGSSTLAGVGVSTSAVGAERTCQEPK